MNLRSKLYSLLAAMLYAGPLLAGLAGAPEALVVVFVGIFTLWVVVMRPAIWKAISAEGAPLALALHLGSVTVLQSLLVIFCFAIGRGIAVLLGATLAIPPILPVLLSAAALLVARAFWQTKADRVDAFLDEAIQTRNEMARDGAPR